MARDRASLFEFDQALAATLHGSSEPLQLIGIDEAGRGPWAGPVVAAAVCLPPGFHDVRLDDSKKLTAAVRRQLDRKIRRLAHWGVGISEVPTIDSDNILQATYQAMRSALLSLLRKNPHLKPGLIVIDGRGCPPIDYPRRAIVDGDALSACIAAASVVAKEARDRMMVQLDKIYPQYGFARHKGYGTKLHQARLAQHGPCPIHRRSFSPVRQALENVLALQSFLKREEDDEALVSD